MITRLKSISIGLTATGLLILVLGVILGWVVAPKVIENLVKDQTQLKNGTEVYDKWSNLPVPVYTKFYFFNVTNSEDFLGLDDWSAKPKLQEIGPYVYKEKRIKYEISTNTTADTLSYRQNVTYTFVPELSVGPETDTVNIINAPLFTVAAVLSTIDRNFLPLPHSSIMEVLLGPLSREKFIKMDVTVKDIIFGWRLNFIYDIFVAVGGTFYGLKFPPELDDGKFGAYLNKNGTNSDGLWEIFSGVKDNTKTGMLKSINGRSEFPENWKDNCAFINGSDGTIYPAFLKKESSLYIYTTDACRSVWLTYEKEIEFEGIPAYRYNLPTKVFGSPSMFPPNDCYCMPVPEPLVKACNSTGILRLFSCKSGAPVVVSKPHFLDSDEFIQGFIDGLKPNRDLHDTFMDVMPMLGLPVRGHKRIQVGIETQPLPIIGAPWSTIRYTFFPFLWLDEQAELDEALIDEIKSKFVTPLKLIDIGKWTAVALGVVLIISGAAGFGYFMWRE